MTKWPSEFMLPANDERVCSDSYWKIEKFPSRNHKSTKIKMVDKQPPPSFQAPNPAAIPRNALLIFFSRLH